MPAKRTFIICSLILFCLAFSASCAQSPATGKATPTTTAVRPTVLPTLSPTLPTPSPTLSTTPTHFKTRVLVSHFGRPDDLVFDLQGRLVFSDFYNGTISRLNANGSITVLLRGIAGPEGMVYLPDGTLIVAEQRTNRILKLAPGDSSLTVLRALPGTPSSAPCKDGVDGIAYDPTNGTLIIPDSPIGNVYRMSTDGMQLKLIASGIVRPVGAAVDAQGNVYVADECGGAVVRIAPGGKTTKLGGFGMPDDVAFDPHGNMLVIDLEPSIHALIRVRAGTGAHETLLSKGLIEPQGLLVDARDNIYVSDDYADTIVELIPA